MRSARRRCLRGAVIAGGLVGGLTLGMSGCQFPDYHFSEAGSAGVAGASGGAGSGGTSVVPAAGDSSLGGENAAGAPPNPPSLCETARTCAPALEDRWIGPVAFWEGDTGQAPADCPKGYSGAQTLHRDLNAPDLPCNCTCAPAGQVCSTNATPTIYSDRACATSCVGAASVACAPVSVSSCGMQGSFQGALQTPSGGRCVPTIAPATEPTWLHEARICPVSSSDPGLCLESGEVCAPPPTLPYLSQVCVVQVVASGAPQPSCPTDYPNAREPLYASYADARGCSTCTCGALTGGSCMGTVSFSASTDCSSGKEYPISGACQTFERDALGGSVGVQYKLTPGTCSVASAPHPTGSAATSGSVTYVCCAG